jgi:RNA polymerase sigma-70 factor (ECF subfamily)
MRHVTHDRIVRWFRELRDPLRRFLLLRRAVSPADIDDVAQEVFLRMLRYDRHELVAHPQAYLFKMAANVAAEWSIRAGRRQPHASEWLTDLAADSSPESDLQRDSEEAALRRALENLSPRAREVMRLHFAEGLTHQAIAERLRVTRRVVKREMIRAYAMLRGSLYGAGFEAGQGRRRQP